MSKLTKEFETLNAWVQDINPKYQLEWADSRMGNRVAIVEYSERETVETHSDFMTLSEMRAHIMGIKGSLGKEYNERQIKSVYIVYEGDTWLSWASMDVQGIFLTKEDAINAIVEHNRYSYSDFFEDEDEEELTDEEKKDCVREAVRDELLRLNGQTQCHNTNYSILQYSLGEWD